MIEEEAPGRARQLIPVCNEPIVLPELESHLARAADLLRGAVDQADFKAFIFPLMFFKRISDTYLEEYGHALADSGGDHEFASFAENHRFQIPDGCLWDDVRARTVNVGQALVTAFRGIEKANPDTLYGIFGNAPWTNKQKLSDETVMALVEHFSEKPLTNACVPPDVFGQAYEYLIKRFADLSNKKAGEYYTPRPVVRLLVNILDPREGETVYDPTCGTGGMLISCAAEVKRRGQEHRTLRLYGQERNYTTASIAKMNLFLHGVEDGRIAHGDTLTAPAFLDAAGRLRRFDVVLANPPYSIKAWNRAAFATDPYGRNMWGVPPQGRADYAFFQHIAASLKPSNGRAAILFPHGVLFRQEEKALRERLVRSGLLESVIGLGAGLFYNSPMEAVVVTLRTGRPTDQAGSVLFINAIDLVARERAQSFLRDSDQATIVDVYQRRADIPGLATVATVEQTARNDYSLAIPLYVARRPLRQSAAAGNGLGAAVSAWRAAADQADAALTDVLELLRSEAPR